MYAEMFKSLESLPKGRKLSKSQESWNSSTVLPDQMGPSVWELISCMGGRLGLIAK